MTATAVQLLSAAETAHVLRIALGQRQWRDFLADCIRDRTPGVGGGVKLMPYAATSSAGRAARPLYRAVDVRRFVEEARASDPRLRPKRVSSDLYMVDATFGLHWARRKATSETPSP